jgi:hypothetical protein
MYSLRNSIFKEPTMITNSQLASGIAALLGLLMLISGAYMSFQPSSAFAAIRPQEPISPAGSWNDIATASLAESVHSVRRGVVILVHPQKRTSSFLGALHLRVRDADSGRFVVIKLMGDTHKDAPYALVHVPQNISVKTGDIVELEPGINDVLRQPGQAVVAMVVPSAGRTAAKIVEGNTSNVVLVTKKDGRLEVWIEDPLTGDVKIVDEDDGHIQ